MNHGQYKSNECRINYKITDLPVSFGVAQRLAHRLNADIMTYQQAKTELSEYGLDYMVKDHKGFSVATENGGYLIYMDAELDSAEKTKVLLHECGHIYCGHIAVRPLGMPNEIDSTQEAEANEFALFFAAPPYVIHKLKLDNVEKNPGSNPAQSSRCHEYISAIPQRRHAAPHRTGAPALADDVGQKALHLARVRRRCGGAGHYRCDHLVSGRQYA